MSTPAVQLLANVFLRQETIFGQAFAAKLAVERLDEGVGRWLARPPEVQRHAPLISP